LSFIRLWWAAISKPLKMIEELAKKPAPLSGFLMVLTRFIITSATSLLALYLLHRLPFAPSRLTFLPIEKYYGAEIFFLPVWGIGMWLLMAALVHLLIRLARRTSNYDQILNIIGMGMLTPMPFLWLWDWAAVGMNIYSVTAQAISHSIAQLWETSIQTIGFKTILGLRLPAAVILALAANALWEPLKTRLNH